MHTVSVLHKLLFQSAPTIHLARLRTIMAAVQALTQGARATVTSLGRGLVGHAYDKHKIKRMDRLLSNQHLFLERDIIYSALTLRIFRAVSKPIILIDWSPLCADQSWQLLRAGVPVGGRSLTLYEEVHPRSNLGNRKVQHQFLDKLAQMIPNNRQPIVVADSGFKTPFYRYIENNLGWDWVGRIRGQDFIYADIENKPGFGAKKLYSKATKTPKHFGVVHWTKTNPLKAFIVLVRQQKKNRTSLTLAGKKRQSKSNKTHANREREPWILVGSFSLQQSTAKQIVNIYKTRMQIEEGFRDCKAVNYGLGLSQNSQMNRNRRAVLCLLVSLATFILWCIGTVGKTMDMARRVRVNSSSKRSPYSVIFLARLLIAQKYFRMPDKAITNALSKIETYTESVLCA